MPAKKSAPTIRQIAEQTGYSRSTVGAALRNRPDIAEATRNKIKAAAEKMGYQKDAEIQRLMSYLRRRRGTRESVSIALLHNVKTNHNWLNAPWNQMFWRGIREQADKLGFDIDLISANDYRDNYQRIVTVMTARGIRGVIFDGSLANTIIDKMELSAFCGVRVGTHPWESRYHSACPDYAYNMNQALENVAELGYERPALALLDYLEDNTDHLYHSTFLWWQQTHLKKKNWIRPLLYSYTKDPKEKKLPNLIEKHEPDVLILNDESSFRRIEEIGMSIPKDIALVHLNLAEDVADWSGIEQGRERMGRATVDILAAQFSRGDVGLPDLPRTVMIRGEWREGKTTQKRRNR